MARLVFVKHRLPFPPTTGTDVVTFNLLRAAATRHDVTLVAPAAPLSPEAAAAFAAAGVRVVPVAPPHKKNVAARAWHKIYYAAAAWLTGTTREMWYFNPPVFRRAVGAAAAAADIVQFEYWYLYPTAEATPARRKVLLAHDAEFIANRRQLAVTRGPFARAFRYLYTIRREGLERTACGLFERVLCLSSADAVALAPYCRRPPRVVFPLVDYPPEEERCRGAGAAMLLYFGGTARAANHQGLARFVRDLLPRIRAAVPGVRFVVRGERPRRSLLHALARTPGARWEPGAADIGAALAAATVAVVPLWVGAGIKVKILTALAYGLPVVTTPVGAEGIVATAADGMVTAPDDDAFVTATVGLLAGGDAWVAAAEGARRWAAREVAWEARAAGVAATYDRLVGE
jgi:glycosyltransferase involved in cell wall biosynthesis